MAKKPYKKWNVYIVGKGEGVYRKDYCREFVGQTWAVSEAQACSNVRFQMRTKDHPYGGPSEWTISDYASEGMVDLHYEAEEA